MAAKNDVVDEDRFEDFDDETIAKMRHDNQPKNTTKSNSKCEKIFITYLKSKKMDDNYTTYNTETLDRILGKFWFEVRQANKQHYTVQSLHHIRYGLNRLFKSKGKDYDITTSPLFSKSQDLFEDACKRLKRLGFGHIQHYKEIIPKGNYYNIYSVSLHHFTAIITPIKLLFYTKHGF